MKKLIYLLPFIFITSATAQDFATIHNNSLLLSNGLFSREIVFENGGIHTKSLKIHGNDLNFNSEKSKEFSLEINGNLCNGESGWDLISFVAASDDHQGNGGQSPIK